MAFRTLATVVAVAEETTPGTFEALTTAADALRTAEPAVLTFGHAAPNTRLGAAIDGFFGRPVSSAPAGRFATLELRAPLVGSGVVDTPPKIGRLLLPFMDEAIVATTSVDYDPITADTEKTLSFLVQSAGKEFQLRGAAPTSCVIRGDAMGRPFVETTYFGIMDVAVAEQTPDLAPGFTDDSAPPVIEGTSIFTVGGVAMLFRNFELNFGLEAATERRTGGGLEYGVVTQINPSITFPAEVEPLGTHNPFTAQADPETPLAFSLTLGSAAGNTFVISADHVEYSPEELGIGDDSGIRMYDLNLGFIKPETGTWLKISHQ